ncbi:cytochrome p450 domain-containing protein [Phthorimaea operculella]|nr:cytochrome p450 domain-containing protein [Phthorimaea operculella]
MLNRNQTVVALTFMGVFNQNSRNVVEKMRPEMGKTFDVHDYMSGVTNSRNVVEKMRPEMGKTFDVHDYMSGVTVDILLALKSSMGVFNQNSRNVVEKMRPEMGKTFDVHDYMSGVTVDILLALTFMGVFNQNSRNVVEKMRPEMGKTFDVHDYMSGVTVDILLVLKAFIGVFNQSSRNVVEKMRPEMGKTFDVHDYMSGVTVDILLVLKAFMGVFNQNSRNVVEKMRPEMGKTFDVHDYMSETAMGITKQTQDESGFDYAMAVMKMCDIIHQRHYKFWLRLDLMFKFSAFFKKQIKLLNIIHGLTNKVIKSKKETYLKNKAKGIIPPTIEELTRETDDSGLANNAKTLADTVFKGYRDDLDFNDENDVGEKKRLAFLDLMIESAQNGTNNISDHEIKEEVDTIMFEGHDTTAAGSSFVLCLLGVHQHIQAKVYDELYEIFGDSDRPVTFADTLQMKYLERVILETLRMYPPVPAIARKLNRDVKISTNGYVLPAGATIVIGTFKIHRNPKYYKNPDVFDPDNFLPENTSNRHYYSFIPFSAGPRSCVGRKYALLKLKVLLATILRNYKMVSDVPQEEFQLQADIILKRSDGFRVRIEPRNRVPSSA